MELNQFLVTDSTPRIERSGTGYTRIGSILADIQDGHYPNPARFGGMYDLRIVRQNANGMAIVTGRTHGYERFVRVWAVVDTATHDVISYYAHLIEGTYVEKASPRRRTIKRFTVDSHGTISVRKVIQQVSEGSPRSINRRIVAERRG